MQTQPHTGAVQNGGKTGRPFWKSKAFSAGMVALAALLAAILFGSGLTLLPGGRPVQRLDLTAAEGEGFTLNADGTLTMEGTGGTVVFSGLGIESANLLVEYRGVVEHAIPVDATLYLEGDDADLGRSHRVDVALLAPRGEAGSQSLLLRSDGALHGFSLLFGDATAQWVITGITVNGAGFSFNWALFCLLLALGLAGWAVVVFGLHLIRYDDDDKKHRWLGRAAALACAALMVVVFLLSAPANDFNSLAWHYDPALTPAEQVDGWPGNAYYNLLFDALYHGQTAVRVTPDPAFVALDNPYDPSQREGLDYLWDACYYEGNYYIYFGLGPVVFYAGCYLLTGLLPSQGLACAVAGALAAVMLWAALRQLLNFFGLRPNLILTLLAVLALALGSLTAMQVSCADGYAQPYLWAGAGLCGMVWLLYGGLAAKTALWRRICLVGAGLGVVTVAACRPAQLLLCLAFALPPALRRLRQKDVSAKAKMLDLTALAVPVAAGAALLMAYNHSRFGSIVEFGQSYQLTVGDMRERGMMWQPAWLLETLRYYLFQPLDITSWFPFVSIRTSSGVPFGNRFFNDRFFGLANLPLFWALPAAPWALRRRPAAQRAVAAGVIAAGLFIFWLNFSLGNLHYRYLTDSIYALALVATVVLLALTAGTAGTSTQAPARALAGTDPWHGAKFLAGCALLLGTIFVGTMLTFTNERNLILEYSPEVVVFLDNMLRPS